MRTITAFGTVAIALAAVIVAVALADELLDRLGLDDARQRLGSLRVTA